MAMLFISEFDCSRVDNESAFEPCEFPLIQSFANLRNVASGMHS
jgi:hypothetical protein